MNGAAIILLGLVAYGTLHINSTVLEAWQWSVSGELLPDDIDFCSNVRMTGS